MTDLMGADDLVLKGDLDLPPQLDAQQSGQRAPFTGGPISGGQATGSGAWTRVAMAKWRATGFG